jgi:D-alanine-D-alanine ligase
VIDAGLGHPADLRREELLALWDLNPTRWAPQNHSCEANTQVDGLDLVAFRPIPKGEKLTLDDATVMNEAREPFDCGCGCASWRGWNAGSPGNGTAVRERGLPLDPPR